MKKLNYTLLVGFCTLIISCGDSTKTNNDVVSTTIKTEQSSASEDKNWEYDHSSTKVKWTGFKLTSKEGVSGGFDSINVSGFKPSSDLATSMTGVTFEIHTQSINSNDSVRDWKLANILFGTMNTPIISGEIKSINEKEESAVINVSMGAASVDVPVSFSFDADFVVKLSGAIDIPTWSEDANNGFLAISKACAEKHENKTWPDVDIKVYTKLRQAE